MYLRRHSQNFAATPISQQGSMLVIALFVIIVLGLLGLTMTRLLSSTSETIIHEVLGQRAINAAKSGIECAVAAKFGAGCSNPDNKDLSGVAGLESCSYSVSETLPKAIKDGGRTFTYLTFTSTGQCTAGTIKVTRLVYVDAMLEVE
jgi:MSHA biogenesis protein MshP